MSGNAQGGAYQPAVGYDRTGATDANGTYDHATFTNSTIAGDTLTSPTITGTVAGGASYTAPTITSPTITGTTSIGSGATLTSPTITAPTITGGTSSGSIDSDYKVLASTATYSADTTPATLTGFSWTVVAGTYVFQVNLPATMTTNGGLTINFLLTTAVLTSIHYQSYAATASDNTTGVSTSGTTAASGTKVFDSATAAYTGVAIRGSFVVGTGGTFAWQGCQHASASGGDETLVLLGAYALLQRVA